MCKIIVGVLFLLGVAAAVPLPAKDELMFEMGGDTAVVESRVRETRQVPANIDELLKPGVHDAFIHTYGNKEGDIGDIQGYRKRINDKGNEGYEHFDSFHKKDSDKYGFEVHKEFGKSGKGKAEGSGKKKRYASKVSLEFFETPDSLISIEVEQHLNK
ncbi:hypothetical protein NQ317_010814 [Molorchus minor]|uniref:Uncharacterized protein n=1 Tax=Molorchus minor TaxID=1323400 RepID=A0ABQ9JSN7_9CUCU|nr:hypothetical protein NQ317_010814 [Molorchus minor]